MGASGIADPETGVEMTVDTPYVLASITKMYTASMVLNLHTQGTFDLEEPISKYLPAALIAGIHVYKGRDYSSQIKVYQLVNQTSGLADCESEKPKGGRSILEQLTQGHDMALDNQQILAIARKLPPAFEPEAGGGTRAHYSDTNYRLLGMIIESVTGRSVAENFEKMIFGPLNLQHTFVHPAEAEKLPQKPAAFFVKDNPAVVPRYLASNRAEGGIVSTLQESLVFLRAFFEGKLFDAKWFDRMTARWNRIFFPMQYGYGMMRVNLPRLFSPFKPFPEYIGHSGSTGSFAYCCRDKGLYFAGTTNQIAAPGRPIRLMMQIGNTL